MLEESNNQHALPLSQRRVDPVAGKPFWFLWLRWNSSDIARAGAVAVPIIIILLLACAGLWRKDTLSRQALKTPLQHSTAIVIDKQINANSGFLDPRSYLILWMNGTSVQVNITEDLSSKWARTSIGQTVAVSYHKGNGIYVVDDWEPPAKKAPINSGLQTVQPNR